MHRAAAVTTLLAALAVAPAASAVNPLPRAEVSTPRLRAGDLFPSLSPAAAALDLGPSPAPGCSRLLDRAELTQAFTDAGIPVPARLPAAVRVLRRMRDIAAPELERLVRDALADHLPRGAVLGAVRAPRTVAVPDGYATVAATVPRPPRRAGVYATAATVTFVRGTEVLAQVSVPVDLNLGPDAAVPDAARGAPVRLVVRRGLVEVTVGAEVGADADIGDTLPVVLHPSGRVVRARLVEPDRAVVLEAP